jgi:hypothetical protein
MSTERGSDDVEAGGWLGTRWRARRRAARRGTEPGLGRDDAWKSIQQEVAQRGGRAAARGDALRRQQGAEQSTCPRKKKRGEGSGGPIWKFQESQGPLGKLKFSTDVEI